MLGDEYIFQEMLEQERISDLHQTLPLPRWPAASGRLILTGAGDSFCGALFGRWLLEQRGQVSGIPALQASQEARHLSAQDLIVGISVSGHTARVLEAAERALAVGAKVVAVTDNSQSPLAQLATVVWPIYASPAEELRQTNYNDEHAKQYVGYHHDVAQTKTFWAVLLTLIRAAQVKMDWQTLLDHTGFLLSSSFYEPFLNNASIWAQSGQTFFLGSGWARIIARFACYKMFEFNRLAHFTGIEEFCHTHYFITKTSDTVVFLVNDQDVAARAAEIVPVIQELFDAQSIWIQAEPFAEVLLPPDSLSSIKVMNLPAAGEPVQRFLDFVLALQWLTYLIGRVEAVDINTFHAGYDTERLVAGTLRTIRRSAIRVSAPNKQTNGKDEPR